MRPTCVRWVWHRVSFVLLSQGAARAPTFRHAPHLADASGLCRPLCPCRRQLIDTATCMLETLNHRRQPHVACWEASLVLGSPQPDGGYGSVVTLTAAALEAMQLAQEGMVDVVACLLDWMGVLHREWREVEACVQRSEQHSGIQGQQLLGVSDGVGAVVAATLVPCGLAVE